MGRMSNHVFFSADDFGGCMAASRRIARYVGKGWIRSVSIFGTCPEPEQYLRLLPEGSGVGIHLDLTEGRPLSDASKIPLLTGKNGRFHDSFFRLVFLSLTRRREIEAQAYTEISAQISHILAHMPPEYAIRIDSHRHFHMIPAVCRAMCRALQDCGREVAYIRFPVEQLSVYALTPGVWRYIKPVNLLKVLVLNACGAVNKQTLQAFGLQGKSALFCGVMFSGHMTQREVGPVGKKLAKVARHKGRGLEFLFHPGWLKPGEPFPDRENPFLSFYESENRRLEARALKGLHDSISEQKR